MWTYNSKIIEELPEDCVGFVYLIVNKTNSRMYIGKKLSKFSKTTYKTVTLKNGTKKKKKIKSKIDSDWMDYYGSSEEVKALVEEFGADRFKRKILRLCKTTAEMSYFEMKEQVVNDVLLKPNEYYNAFVGAKIHRNHLKHLIK